MNKMHDGDMMTANGIMSEEAVKENVDYLNSPASIVSVDGNTLQGLSTSMANLTLFNITRKI